MARLDSRTNAGVSFVAAVATETICFPVDTIKCWTQLAITGGTQQPSISSLRSGSIGRLYNGVALGTSRLALSSTAMITLPQVAADMLQSSGVDEITAVAAATPVATFCANLVLVPLELVKTRLQAHGALTGAERTQLGAIASARHVVATSGVQGLWVGALPTVLRTTVYWSVGSPAYRLGKRFLVRLGLSADSASTHVVAAAGAALCATAVSHPFDLTKTLLQGRESQSTRYRSFLHCLGDVAYSRGLRGLTAGFWPRYLRQGSWQLLFFLIYERGLLLTQGKSL